MDDMIEYYKEIYLESPDKFRRRLHYLKKIRDFESFLAATTAKAVVQYQQFQEGQRLK